MHGRRAVVLERGQRGRRCSGLLLPGSIEKRLDQAERITCPTLFHFAEEDDHIDSDAVAAVQEKMTQVGQSQIETYPGVDHGFNCWARPAYNQNAAALAHGRSLVFLAENL